jgi:hypothetical protein
MGSDLQIDCGHFYLQLIDGGGGGGGENGKIML